ncbi:MAG TPA: hypothetical protein VHQ47_17595 [Phycisphaerae bacterium]|nr:hypothetical protein [Phycisphaerae bacterium]
MRWTAGAVWVAVAAALVGGCAETRYPGMMPAGVVERTDRMSREFLAGVAAGDEKRVMGAGLSEGEAADAMKGIAKLAVPVRAKFLLDMPVGDRYGRQYAVATAAGGEVEIRCWFRDAREPVMESWQVLGPGE